MSTRTAMFHIFSLINVRHLISVYYTHFIISVPQSFRDYGIIVVVNSTRYVHIYQQISHKAFVSILITLVQTSDGCCSNPPSPGRTFSLQLKYRPNVSFNIMVNISSLLDTVCHKHSCYSF